MFLEAQFSLSYALGKLLTSEQIMSADKYLSTFLCKMETIVCVL